jgi:photosystem II stability/assembly factor-like uncharacterized protein
MTIGLWLLRSAAAGLIVSTWLAAGRGTAQEWQAVTTELLQKEKKDMWGLCGVVVDHRTGHLLVDISERGFYRSEDQGKSWKRLGDKNVKGRTEVPGCLMVDPVGKGTTIVSALVYGEPIVIGTDAGMTWRLLDKKSSHIDYCAVDWSDPEMKFVLAVKHEQNGLMIFSRDGGKSFEEVGKDFGPAWIFDNNTAVVAEAKSKAKPQPGLLRTTDGGQSFKPCGTYVAKALPRWQGDKLWWLVEGALVTTTDKGQTWTKVCDLKDGRVGPVFGKDAKHLFVLTGAGIVESTDGGASWSKALAIPKDLKSVSPLTWMEYDPVHDMLYMMKMRSELYKLDRGK